MPNRLGSAAVAVLLLCIPVSAKSAEDHADYFDAPFASGPEVTETCLACHADAATEVMATTHWTWSAMQTWEGGSGPEQRGKVNSINNFCIAVGGNWPRCTSCHAGYGWKDASFDFTDETRVDCLVCHDGSGTYRKQPDGAGAPAADVDLLAVARSVGPSSAENCGSCHFYGGGGDHVKHGDLDSSLLGATRDHDVHMSPDGAGFGCTDCHTTEAHQIRGNSFAVSPGHDSPIGCIDCHDAAPHEQAILNEQHQRLACQTCHIPFFAKQRPTMVAWDWSVAGQDRPQESDEYGLPTYDKKKGAFRWEQNVAPTYAWYDGRSSALRIEETIDPEQPVHLTRPLGSKDEDAAQIHPFKVHRGRQIYDRDRRVLIVPKLYGKGGYWDTLDWDQAARLGMASVDQPYSGQHGFVDTVMYWRINHMVVPGESAVKCIECHGRGDRMDWVALGYGDDPIRLRRAERDAKYEKQ